MEERFFAAMGDDQQAITRRALEQLTQPTVTIAGVPVEEANPFPRAHHETRRQRRARERAEAKIARREKVGA